LFASQWFVGKPFLVNPHTQTWACKVFAVKNLDGRKPERLYIHDRDEVTAIPPQDLVKYLNLVPEGAEAMTKRIPRPGQILLISIRLVSIPEFFRYLVVVLQVQTDHRGKYTAITRVIAIKKDQVWDRNYTPTVDDLYEINVNDLKSKGHKVEAVGLEYLPRCMAWHRRTTYERLLRREPIEAQTA
jgi:hypothetical protein